jgi:APA family basic amino acid/polyamine antiporter
LPTAAALVVGGTIGVGIFLTPASMAAALASPGLLLAVWLFLGGSALCGALCFGELAARYPTAGGGYVYLREAFGPRLAFLYGWKCLLVMDPGLTAALATGLGAYAAVVVPGLAPKAVAVGAILLVAGAYVAGIRMASGIGSFLGVG